MTKYPHKQDAIALIEAHRQYNEAKEAMEMAKEEYKTLERRFKSLMRHEIDATKYTLPGIGKISLVEFEREYANKEGKQFLKDNFPKGIDERLVSYLRVTEEDEPK